MRTLAGTADQYESKAPELQPRRAGTYKTDRECSDVSPECSESEFQIQNATAEQDRLCTPCESECKNPGEYHPHHLDAGSSGTNYQFGIPCTGADSSGTFAEIKCLECPDKDVDLIFLVDVGDSMIDKLGQGAQLACTPLPLSLIHI